MGTNSVESAVNAYRVYTDAICYNSPSHRQSLYESRGLSMWVLESGLAFWNIWSSLTDDDKKTVDEKLDCIRFSEAVSECEIIARVITISKDMEVQNPPESVYEVDNEDRLY